MESRAYLNPQLPRCKLLSARNCCSPPRPCFQRNKQILNIFSINQTFEFKFFKVGLGKWNRYFLIMWKIRQKYPLIELMSYIEFKQTQILFYRSSQDFRQRLIRAFEQIKKTSKVIETFPTIDAKIYVSYQRPIMLFTTESTWSEIQCRETQYLNLRAEHYYYDDTDRNQTAVLKQIDSSLIFAKISIILNCQNSSSFKYGLNRLISLQDYFQLSQFVSFNIIANSMPVDRILSFKNYGIRSIELLQIRVNQCIKFSKQSLQNVRELQMDSYGLQSFNLQFEDLSVPYKDTQFSLVISCPQKNVLPNAFTNYPDLFNIQCCKIIFHSSVNLCFYALNEIKKSYSNSPIIIKQFILNAYGEHSITDRYWNIIKQNNFFDSCNKSFDFITVKLASIVETEKLIIHTMGYLYTESLSKFKITKEVEIQCDQNINVIQSDYKCECPPLFKINIGSGNRIIQIAQITGILNGFYKYENAKEVKFHWERHNFAQDFAIIEIIKKFFCNITSLSMPLPENEKVSESIVGILKTFNKLINLTFHQTENKLSLKCEYFISLISRSVIENLKGLRRLNFHFKDQIKSMDLTSWERIEPLTITLFVKNKTQFIFDARYGMKWIQQERFQDRS